MAQFWAECAVHDEYLSKITRRDINGAQCFLPSAHPAINRSCGNDRRASRRGDVNRPVSITVFIAINGRGRNLMRVA